MGPSSITSCIPPTLMTKSHSLTSLSQPAAVKKTFLEDLLALEKWPPETTLLAPLITQLISWPENSSLRIWFPDVDSHLSPQHGITVCCGRAGERARSHGPTMATVISTKNQPTGRELFGTPSFLTFPSMNLLPRSFIAPWIIGSGILLMPFLAPPSIRFSPHIRRYATQYRAGLHAWRLPPHTLAYNLYNSCVLHVRS